VQSLGKKSTLSRKSSADEVVEKEREEKEESPVDQPEEKHYEERAPLVEKQTSA